MATLPGSQAPICEHDRIGGEPDALAVRSNDNALSKPAALGKVLENLELAERTTGQPRRITISTVIEHGTSAKSNDFWTGCAEQDCFFCGAVREMEKMPIWRYCKIQVSSAGGQNHRAGRKRSSAHINGTPRTI